MIRPASTRRPPLAPNLTPMIDVVFLLIVFFLVSSHLARQEARIDVNLPAAATGQRSLAPAGRWTIDIPRDGRPQLSGEPIDAATLLQRLREQAETPPAVRLRGDGATDFATIEPLLAACAEGGVSDISFGVFPVGE
ncbi:MAG: biopolymer transporter ExbD [Planctomycetota bacterium]